jgi:hypothetical protein
VASDLGQVGRVDPSGAQVGHPGVTEVVRGAVQPRRLAGGLPYVAVEVALPPDPAGRSREQHGGVDPRAARARSRTSGRGRHREALLGQVTKHAAQGHLCVPVLKAVLDGAADPGLRFRRLHALEEEIRVAAKLVGRRQRYRVDAVLDNGVTGGGETGDSPGERADEATELVGRQGSIVQP